MLVLDRVSREFANGAGVREVDLHVPSGQVVALIGLNGAGKTTLMRLALGMLRPGTGGARLFGEPLPALPASRWREVGALVGAPPAYPELTARENLRIVARLRGVPTADVEAVLQRWTLTPVADRRFRHLSLGNRQRVGLAAALGHRPRLIVLDEPSSGLDPAAVIVLREVLRQRAAAGAGVLISSHHLDEVARIADRIVVLNRGRLIGDLDPTAADLERVFFRTVLADDERRDARRGLDPDPPLEPGPPGEPGPPQEPGPQGER